MGLNSPIELKMTEAGLAAKENAESIIFTRFLAGSTGDTGSTSVTSIKQVIPINNYVKRIAGQEYIQDGVTQVANESFLSISGFANSLDAENEYVLNEIALMAKLDENGEEFCFAYDWSNSYKYRIRTDLSQPITVQYKIVLTRVPQLTINTSETGVTFSDLYAHTEKTVTQTPVHGLKCVDGVLTVNNQALHKSTVGLGNVDNTSDLDKPISTAVQTALDDLEDRIDAIDETGSSITLASLGGASATDLTNHISDTSNPHSVTYSQTGAAAASHTHVEADITDLGSYASSSHTHVESDITDLGNYANASHTHTESDITDLRSYASNTDLDTYGVSAVSFDNSTSILTITMKGGSTKTVTITSATSGSGSGSSGSSLSISSVSYDDTTNNIVFTMSDNSEITCNLDDLLDRCLRYSVPDGNSSLNDSLDFALIDPSSNKVYSSGISLSELNTSISGLASASHTHVKSDITDISDLATASSLNTYGVSSMSFDTSTNVLTLTMKDGNTKTVTIPASSGNSGLTVSSISYDNTNERLVFTMSDNSTINCDISDLIAALNITYDPLDSRTYNSEWEDRITGAGTELDPYLIYTPKDFMKINDDMTAHYKLMNNLDFAPVIGMNIEINGEGYEITTTDNSASLYHSGEGFWPIGYDGYFPLNGETKSTKTFAEANWGGEIVYGTNNAALAYIFTGELDGNSKFIKGIVSSPINTYSVALFSFLGNGASVHNLTIKDSVFIVNDVYATGDKKSSVASIAGNLIYTNGIRNPVNIYNVYNYATIISNRSTSNGDDYAQINGIFGRLNGDENPGYIVRECANHGELIIVNDSVHHGCSGIGYYKFYNNNNNRIINCINTANLYGYKIWGIGQNIGKVNINCGNMSKSNQSGNIYPITDHLNNSYIDGKQFANNTIQSIADSTYRNDGTYNIYYKSTAELKSQYFIDEANALLPEPVFIYNDLNVNNGWPLLIDEYNTLIGVNGNLNLSLIDPINNKLYKSGYSLEKLQKVVTYREMNSEINGQFDQYVSNQLGGLKTISLTIATSNWTAEEENGTPTGNYLATVSVNGITPTSPVQLMTQLTDIEILISQIASNSVTLITNTQPQSNIRVAIMFVP